MEGTSTTLEHKFPTNSALTSIIGENNGRNSNNDSIFLLTLLKAILIHLSKHLCNLPPTASTLGKIPYPLSSEFPLRSELLKLRLKR